jgi:CubicO group peptidase (beta-lactamase class C family)
MIRNNILKMHLMLALISVSSLFIDMLAVAQTIDGVKIPDTPAGKTFATFLTAFNTGDIEKLHNFYTGLGDDPSKTNQDLNAYNKSGGLKLYSVIKSSDYEIEVLVQTMKTGEWFGFIMSVSTIIPYPIELRGMRAASAPEKASDKIVSESSTTTGNLTDTEIASSLGAYLDELTKEDKFSGVVLIAKDGKPVFEKAYGLANKSKNIPNDIETKFNLGSMNKMFTAVAIAQLAEAGKLSFDDKVGKYLLDYTNKQVADNVTIHQLLTHTSGLGLYWNDKYQIQKSNIRTVADYLALFADEPLLFEPGQRYQYSNSGYIVLGAIIEKVSGQNYYDYVRDHIYKPAGMKNTDAYELSQDTPNLAMGYTANGQPASGPRLENTSTLPNRGGPAGGGYSTTEDLLRFSIALRTNKLLSSRYTEIVTTGKVTGGPGKYGYGFSEEILNGKRIFGHNGGAPGVAADMSIFPESGHVAVVLMNYDPELMPPVVNQIRELIQ